MLSEIAAEVLHFLTHRDLDKACAISKWLEAMIAQCCDVFPLRPVHKVTLYRQDDSPLKVWINEDGLSTIDRYFSSMDEIVRFAASILRRSYVERLQKLTPDHWMLLTEAILSGSVRRFEFFNMDFSALGNDALLVAIGCRNVRSLVLQQQCVMPSGWIIDDLIRAAAAKNLRLISFYGNNVDAPHRTSDNALLNFFFPADAAPGGPARSPHIQGATVTDTFAPKFFERLLSSPARPSGKLTLYGAPKQRRLAAYAQYAAPGASFGTDVIYRFPSIDGHDNSYYEVSLCGNMRVDFGLVRRSS